jgi:hypothetical protein
MEAGRSDALASRGPSLDLFFPLRILKSANTDAQGGQMNGNNLDGGLFKLRGAVVEAVVGGAFRHHVRLFLMNS